jgi:hypothetical protein
MFFPAIYFAGKSAFEVFKKRDEFNIMVFSFGSVPLIFFIYSSLFKKILPHWPVIGYITLTLPVGRFYYEMFMQKRNKFKIYAYIHSGIVGSLIIIALFQFNTGLVFNRAIPDSGTPKKEKVKDLSIELIGWKQLDEYLGDNFDAENNFIFTYKWYLGGQIQFYTKGKYPLLCLNSKKSITGYSVWQNQEKYLGKNGLFITTSRFFRDPAVKYKDNFESINLLKTIQVKRRGVTVKKIYVYLCENFRKIYPVD